MIAYLGWRKSPFLFDPFYFGEAAPPGLSETRIEENGTTTRVQEDGATRITEGS